MVNDQKKLIRSTLDDPDGQDVGEAEFGRQRKQKGGDGGDVAESAEHQTGTGQGRDRHNARGGRGGTCRDPKRPSSTVSGNTVSRAPTATAMNSMERCWLE